MAKPPSSDMPTLDAATRPAAVVITSTEIVAAALSLVWLILAGGLLLLIPGEGGNTGGSARVLFGAMTVILPIAMIWAAAVTVRTRQLLREESRRLQAAIDALRKLYLTERQARNAGAPIAEIARQAQTARPAPPAPAPGPAREEEPQETGPALANADLIRALHFPESVEDIEGIAALRRALRNRKARQIIQASQDMLTLLSQDGIYMDDLEPDPARPEIWRRFAKGERGGATAALGGVRDPAFLEPSAARMREDTIYRDAAHHFLRLFDRTLTDFEQTANDAEIAALAETRSARAFMLLGRVTGTFG